MDRATIVYAPGTLSRLPAPEPSPIQFFDEFGNRVTLIYDADRRLASDVSGLRHGRRGKQATATQAAVVPPRTLAPGPWTFDALGRVIPPTDE